jgi:hypothetical protein
MAEAATEVFSEQKMMIIIIVLPREQLLRKVLTKNTINLQQEVQIPVQKTEEQVRLPVTDTEPPTIEELVQLPVTDMKIPIAGVRVVI